jgi:hypothetical protein
VRFREVFLRVGVGECAFGRVLCAQFRRIFAFSFEFFELFLCPAGKMLVLNESGLRVAIIGRKSVSFNGACLAKALLPPNLTSIVFHSNYYKLQEDSSMQAIKNRKYFIATSIRRTDCCRYCETWVRDEKISNFWE